MVGSVPRLQTQKSVVFFIMITHFKLLFVIVQLLSYSFIVVNFLEIKKSNNIQELEQK